LFHPMVCPNVYNIRRFINKIVRQHTKLKIYVKHNCESRGNNGVLALANYIQIG